MQQINNVYSDLKILCHPDKLSAILNGQRTAPLYVRIKPTNICNQNCWYCVYANDKVIENRSVDRRESIPWEKMQEIINNLSEMGTKAITFSGGGEPLCYHHIYETLELVRQKNIDYAMISNGQALDEKARKVLKDAKWLRISLDSVNQEMYQSIRGVNTYSVVMENIEKFAQEKNAECVLGVNFVITKDNYSKVYEMCKILSGIGVDNVKFSPLMVKGAIPEYHKQIRGNIEEQLMKAKSDFQDEHFSIIDKYTNDASFDKQFEKKCSHCYIKEIFTVIGADCNVYYCHQRAYTQMGMIGSLTNQSFKELWFSDETTEKFRKMIPQNECNFRCAFEERNELLDSLVNMDKRHINFI
ncbi:MAG: radical SAM protein [Clostridium sp.]|nr:radical SAM protein [Clostridium sp.]